MNLKPSTYIAAIVIFTFFIIGGVAIFSEMNSIDGDYINKSMLEEFNTTFEKYDKVIAQSDTLKAAVSSNTDSITKFGVLDGLINVAWSSIRLVFTSFGFFNDVLEGLSTFFGVPTWIVSLATALIVILLVFAVFSAIFQKEV